MTKEELLKPRYKVIADYPQHYFKGEDKDNEYKFIEGDILAYGKVNNSMTYRRIGRCGYMSVGIPCESNPELYPKIFRKLEWWEEREEKDMPEYVKVKRASLVPKKDIPFFAKVTDRIHTLPVLTGFKLSDGTDGLYANWANLEPATKEEYESQTNIQ